MLEYREGLSRMHLEKVENARDHLEPRDIVFEERTVPLPHFAFRAEH